MTKAIFVNEPILSNVAMTYEWLTTFYYNLSPTLIQIIIDLWNDIFQIASIHQVYDKMHPIYQLFTSHLMMDGLY